MQTLPVSQLIKVGVILTPAGAQAQNLSSLLVLGNSPVIDSVERMRTYASLAGVALDFSNVAPEYQAAALWFAQAPQPTTLKIGRWAKTAAAGVLRGAPLSAAQQALANFTAVTSGGFTYTKNGGTATNVTAINLSGALNLNGVAALITSALTGATMTWNASFGRFELTSGITGGTSTVSFLTAPGTGTDISALLGMTSASGGAYTAPGVALETGLQAVQLFDNQFGQSWYGLVIPEASDADHEAVAGYVEGANTKHLYGITTQDAGTLVPATTTDISSVLKARAYKKTMVQFSSSNAYAIASAFGRILTVDYNGSATAISLMYKQEPGVVAEALNVTQVGSVTAKNCNVFVGYDNSTNILQRGVMSSGNFVDEITGTDWLAVTMQNALYNLLYTSTTKVPQTDAGMQLLVTTCDSICAQAVVNGLLAPGVWNSGGFGALVQGDFMPKGFYTYAPRVATQLQSDRTARKSVPIQVAAKLAGAIHDISVTVTVNQ